MATGAIVILIELVLMPIIKQVLKELQVVLLPNGIMITTKMTIHQKSQIWI